MFYIKIDIKLFCKLIPILLLARARHAQMTQNDKSIISLQYLKKKKERFELDLLHGDKHTNFLRFETINPSGHGQSCPKYPK